VSGKTANFLLMPTRETIHLTEYFVHSEKMLFPLCQFTHFSTQALASKAHKHTHVHEDFKTINQINLSWPISRHSWLKMEDFVKERFHFLHGLVDSI